MTDLKLLAAHWRADERTGRRVVALGSSNTEKLWHSLGRHGWPDWLECAMREWIGRHVSLVNVGISGETGEDMLARFDRDVLPHAPSLVVLTTGGNDIKYYGPQKYGRVLSQLIERIRAAGGVPVVQTYYAMLIDEADPVYQGFPAYMAASAEHAAAVGVACIDQHRLFYPWYQAEPQAYRRIMLDPLHLNPLGNAILGTLCVRRFGLPDPLLPPDLQEPVADALGRMARYAELPPNVAGPPASL